MRYLCLTVFFLFVFCPVYTPVSALDSGEVNLQPTTKQVEELYLKSGLNRQVEALPGQVDALLQGQQEKIPPEMLTLMKKELLAGFQPEKLKSRLLERIQERLPALDLVNALKWLDSPLGKKITLLEEEASTAEAAPAMMAYMQSTDPAGLPADRQKILREFNDLAGATDLAMDTGIFLNLAIVTQLRKLDPEMPPLTEKEMMDFIESNRAAIRHDVDLQVQLSLHFCYQKLTTAELQSYLEFARSESGINYHQVVVEAHRSLLYDQGDGHD